MESRGVNRAGRLMMDSFMAPGGGWPEVTQGKVEPGGVEQSREASGLWMTKWLSRRRELLQRNQSVED